MATIFVTGYPGFLASVLVPRLLATDGAVRVVCLIQPHYLEAALARRTELPGIHRHRLHFVQGDIKVYGLGLERGSVEYGDVTEIFHLAAVYDLNVDRETANAVNLNGTRNIIDFAHACRSLDRLHYVSTCYVSGRYEGTFTANHLVCGQPFNNFYDESKYRAEVEIQAAMRGGMPITVYRPSIVVGDSRSGATQKFDGPYPIIRWMLRLPRVAVLPVVGRPDEHYVNLVPSDFVVDALFELSRMPHSRGMVYHLSDPNPMTVSDAIDVLSRVTNRSVLRVPMPLAAAKAIVRQIARLDRGLGIEPTLVDYFRHPTRYTCENTLRDLEGTGIECPPFAQYADRLVDFVAGNPSISPRGLA